MDHFVGVGIAVALGVIVINVYVIAQERRLGKKKGEYNAYYDERVADEESEA